MIFPVHLCLGTVIPKYQHCLLLFFLGGGGSSSVFLFDLLIFFFYLFGLFKLDCHVVLEAYQLFFPVVLF